MIDATTTIDELAAAKEAPAMRPDVVEMRRLEPARSDPMRPSRLELRFFVDGNPATQGSLTPRWVWSRHKNRHVLRNVHDPKVERWRSRVRIAARQEMKGRRLVDAPVVLAATFFLARPKSVRRIWPTSQADGDADKFLRALGDSLEGTVLTNDARIVASAAVLAYHDRVGLEGPGALVELSTLDGGSPYAVLGRLLANERT